MGLLVRWILRCASCLYPALLAARIGASSEITLSIPSTDRPLENDKVTAMFFKDGSGLAAASKTLLHNLMCKIGCPLFIADGPLQALQVCSGDNMITSYQQAKEKILKIIDLHILTAEDPTSPAKMTIAACLGIRTAGGICKKYKFAMFSRNQLECKQSARKQVRRQPQSAFERRLPSMGRALKISAVAPERVLDSIRRLEDEVDSEATSPNQGIDHLFEIFRSHREERTSGALQGFFDALLMVTNLHRSDPGNMVTCEMGKRFLWLLTKWRFDAAFKFLLGNPLGFKLQSLAPLVDCREQDLTCDYLGHLEDKCKGAHRDKFSRLLMERAYIFSLYVRRHFEKSVGPMIQPAAPANGWKILGSPIEGSKWEARSCKELEALVGHGGAAVIRVGVEKDNRKRYKSLAMWHPLVLVRKDELGLQEQFTNWEAPLAQAIRSNKTSSEEVYNRAAEARMGMQVDRVQIVLHALEERLPKDFGTVYVLLQLEEERQLGINFGKTPKFGIVAVKYKGDEDSLGDGGIRANIATGNLHIMLSDLRTRCSGCFGKHITAAYAKAFATPSQNSHTLLRKIYSATFGYASVYLGAEDAKKAFMERKVLSEFLADCRKSANLGAITGICDVNEANRMITDYDNGDTTLSTQQAWALSKFLNKFGGVTSRMKKRKDAELDRSLRQMKLVEESRAREEYEAHQASAQALREAGNIELEDSAFSNRVVSPFFKEALMQRNWVCFRLGDNMRSAEYRIFGGTQDGTDMAMEFTKWQDSLSAITSNGEAISSANVYQTLAGAKKHEYVKAMKDHTAASKDNFNEAARLLEAIEDSQTLCVHRFYLPLKQPERDAVRLRTFDLPTMWEGTVFDQKIANVLKARAVKNWLLQSSVIESDFLRSARQNNFGTTYERAAKLGER